MIHHVPSALCPFQHHIHDKPVMVFDMLVCPPCKQRCTHIHEHIHAQARARTSGKTFPTCTLMHTNSHTITFFESSFRLHIFAKCPENPTCLTIKVKCQKLSFFQSTKQMFKNAPPQRRRDNVSSPSQRQRMGRGSTSSTSASSVLLRVAASAIECVGVERECHPFHAPVRGVELPFHRFCKCPSARSVDDRRGDRKSRLCFSGE